MSVYWKNVEKRILFLTCRDSVADSGARKLSEIKMFQAKEGKYFLLRSGSLRKQSQIDPTERVVYGRAESTIVLAPKLKLNPAPQIPEI